MTNSNYKPGIGRLATDRYDFQKHIDGNDFRHQADNIDLNPTVSIDTGSGTVVATEVQEAIEALASNTVVPTVDPATATTYGTVMLDPAGDVTGVANALRVTKIQGFPVLNITPANGFLLTWNGSAWEPQTPSFAINPATTTSYGTIKLNTAGDLGPDPDQVQLKSIKNYPIDITATPLVRQFIGWDGSKFTNDYLPHASLSEDGTVKISGDIGGTWDDLKVVGLQGYDVSNECPECDEVLVWDCISNQWVPSNSIAYGNLPYATSSNQGVLKLAGDLDETWDLPKVAGWKGISLDNTFLEPSSYAIPYYDDGNEVWKTAFIGDFTGKDLYSASYNEQEVRGIYGNAIIDQDGYASAPNNRTILVYLDALTAAEIFAGATSAGWYPVDADLSAFTPGNDLSGDNSSQNVIAITGATGATGYTGDLANKYVANVKADYLSSSNDDDFYITKYPTDGSLSVIYVKGQNNTDGIGGPSVLYGGDSLGGETKYGGPAVVVGGNGEDMTGSVYIGTLASATSAGNVYTIAGNSLIGGSVLTTAGAGIFGGNSVFKSGDGGFIAGTSSLSGGLGLSPTGGVGGLVTVIGGIGGLVGGGAILAGGMGQYGGSVLILGGATAPGSTAAATGATAGTVIIGSGLSKDSFLLQVSSTDGGYVGLAASNYISNDAIVGQTGPESNPAAGGQSVVYISNAYVSPTGATANAPTNGTVLYSKEQDLWVARGGTGGITGDGSVNYYDANYSIAAGPNPIRRVFEFPGAGSEYIRSKTYRYTYGVTVPPGASGGTAVPLFEHNDIDNLSVVHLKGNIIATKAGTSRDGDCSIYEFDISYRSDGISTTRYTYKNFTVVSDPAYALSPTVGPTGSTSDIVIGTGYDNTDATDWVINVEAFVSESFTYAAPAISLQPVGTMLAVNALPVEATLPTIN